jgi:hypothetical protein
MADMTREASRGAQRGRGYRRLILFARFDAALGEAGFLVMSGPIVAAPKQRNTIEEKKAIKDGRIPDAWKDKPPKSPRRIATPAGR